MDKFFPDKNKVSTTNLSCKFLYINPLSHLSLQLHHRRSELWHIINGPVTIIINDTEKKCTTGNIIEIPCNSRHQIQTENNSALIAEIWVHTDPKNLSDEFDIVRF